MNWSCLYLGRLHRNEFRLSTCCLRREAANRNSTQLFGELLGKYRKPTRLCQEVLPAKAPGKDKAIQDFKENAMPIYVYRCQSCAEYTEALQKASDPHLSTCPHCGAEALTRVVAPVGVIFKGSGFHKNDYHPKASSTPKKSSGEAESKPASESSASSEASTSSSSTGGESTGSSSSDKVA